MRALAVSLRVFAFGLAPLVAAAYLAAPAVRARLGASSWLASLLPHDLPGLIVWAGIASLNAGAAFALARHLEE